MPPNYIAHADRGTDICSADYMSEIAALSVPAGLCLVRSAKYWPR